ncbi:insulinase family protein [Micromonospora orduensis]|uniref:Insulinase family protein n=1 Tax=Micromonospora orduensis TaxID=1420891 RepID=A0A5C4QWY4_9ACTN|nr:insulinase family protein [Micromonospora orduensis]TNH30585.1 insulinase family protein [Micromonospora orduensis]
MSRSTVLETVVGGLTVVAVQVPHFRSCVGVLSVPVGYGADPAGQEGTAHLTEHICVATAASRERVQMAARTEVSATRYSARATPGSSAALIAALTSTLGARPYPAELHETERRAVLTENARVRDQPQLQIAPAVAARVAPTLDLGLRDTTTETSIGAVTPSDIVDFRQRWYRPEGSVLCLVSPNDPDKLIAEVEAELAAVPPPTDPERAPGSRAPAEPFDVPGWSDCFIWAATTPAVTTPADLLARQLATELLTGRAGLLDEESSAVGTRSTGFATLPGRHADLLVTAWPSGPHCESLADGLRDRLPDVLSNGGGAAAVGRARARLRTRIAFEQQSPGGLASMLVRYALGQGAWPDIREIDAAADDRVVELAVRMLREASFWRIADSRLGEVAV